MLRNGLSRCAIGILLFLLTFVLLAPAAAQSPEDERRIALVVGNFGYRHVPRLANPGNDATLIATTVHQLGFTLVGGGAQENIDKAHFDRLVQDFGRAIQGADVALFYYAGHGMQVDGTNWLVPTDANPTRPQDLEFQMVNADLVLKQMDGAGTRLNLVILDACRNNPFAGARHPRGAGRPGADARAGGHDDLVCDAARATWPRTATGPTGRMRRHWPRRCASRGSIFSASSTRSASP